MKIEILATRTGWIMSDLVIETPSYSPQKATFIFPQTDSFDSAENLVRALRLKLGLSVASRDGKGRFVPKPKTEGQS